MEPDHFYIATWKEVDASTVVSLEPEYESVYTIHRGPFSNVMDAWESAELTDEQWDEAVILGFKGCKAIHAYHELMSDIPTEDAIHATNAEAALTEAVSER